ncbi:glycosyltransferase [Dietzia timorensis]|uniref:Uncharacterized protein n=2 Tax=Dietzia timorensis TaxID=499555 RepID=A0A173LIG9_9ACTN|nr:glycosyltransferase [Dietzia timorensis]ANI91231.1 Hypothetical protein BJL86_0421 [Dietzia timorensis]
MMHPHWFGPHTESLFGLISTPDQAVTSAGVVIVPPLGLEAVTTYRGLRYLSDLLVDAGLTTLRYDHPGAGSSLGSSMSPRAWDGWVSGVGEAVAHLRSLGVTDITVVGVRAGTLILDAASPDVDRVVYLDPPLSGRRWMREVTSLQLMGVGQAEGDPGMSAPGLHISHEAAEKLRTHKWSPNPTVPRLVAPRSVDGAGSPLRPLLDGATRRIDLDEAELFVAPEAFIHHVPAGDMRRIAEAITHAAATGTGVVAAASDVRSHLRMTAEVANRQGERIVERIDVRTARELITFTTFAEGQTPRGTVLFESTANEPAWGPTDMWVRAAREHAGEGLQCVRHDKTGGGDAGEVHEGEIAVLYSYESRDDAEAVARTLDTDPADNLLVGLCSGAWMAAETALRTRAGAVLLFGMLQWARVREPVDKAFLAAHGYDLNTMTIPEVTSEHQREDFRSMVKSLLRDFFPIRMWEELGRRGITQVPGPLLHELDEAAVRTTVVMTPDDLEHYCVHRGDESLRRLRRRGWTGTVRSIDVPRGDHNLYRHDSREQARRALASEVAALRRRLEVPAGRRTPAVPAFPPAPRALFVSPPDVSATADGARWREAIAHCGDIRAEFLDTGRLGALGTLAVMPIPVLTMLGADALSLRRRVVGRIVARRRLAERLSRGDIDVLHLFRPTFVGSVSRLVGRIPLVLTIDRADIPVSIEGSPSGKRTWWRRSRREVPRGLRSLAGSAKHVIATSAEVADVLRGPAVSLPAHAVSVVPEVSRAAERPPAERSEHTERLATTLADAASRTVGSAGILGSATERRAEQPA